MNPVIGIIGGCGLMGGLFADFFKQHDLKVLISDRHTALTNQQLAKTADIVIVSVPIPATEKVIAEVLQHIKKGAAIMDFTSTKEKPVQAMLKGHCEVLGIHPMFGATNPIPGQTIIFTPTKKSGKWSKWMKNFLQKNGAQITTMTPQEHDRMMALAQVLIHSAEISFADALRRAKVPPSRLLQYAGKASELKIMLAARLIAQDADLYGHIQLQNPYAMQMLEYLQKAVDDLVKIVKKKDIAAFKKYFSINKKFLGSYADTAYEESSYLIDKLLELRSPGAAIKGEKPLKTDLAVLGPKNTFSDLAATKYAPYAHKYFARDIEEIFEFVAEGQAKKGIVPVENKLYGTVRETLDNLFTRNVHIISEVRLPIHHALIAGGEAKKPDIRKIFSHSQALRQCKKYLRKNFPRAILESTDSTVAALDKIHDKSVAAIAPIGAVNSGNFQILAENIEDQRDNSTTFIVIRRGPATAAKTARKTSIAFHFSKDAPGTLFMVFKEFAAAKINLTKIESRPTQKRFGDYIFFLDFAGSLKDARVQKVLRSVAKIVARLKIFGSY